MSREHHLWSEAYRPKKISDCILPERMKVYFQAMVDSGKLENMTFVGGPGTGKTTVARALCEELGIDYLLINASEHGNIDTIRTTVRQFASTVSFMGGNESIRCIILDEADFLNAQSSQPALRGAIEEFSSNCRFILTGNYSNRIIDALKSRCPVVEFSFTKEEKRALVLAFDARIRMILEEKGITYDRGDLAKLVMKNFPDFRKTLNLLQRFSASGQLTIAGATGIDNESIRTLAGYLKEKRFGDMRRWVAENLDNDGAAIRRALFDKAIDLVQPASIPQLVLTIAEYDYKESFVVDKEINMVAFLTSVMADVDFK